MVLQMKLKNHKHKLPHSTLYMLLIACIYSTIDMDSVVVLPNISLSPMVLGFGLVYINLL